MQQFRETKRMMAEMKTKVVLLIIVLHISLFAQSSITAGTGSLITIGAGADISAGSKTGSFVGSGTFNGALLNEPYSATVKPTNVLNTSATLNALVNPQGFSTSYYFSYGTDPANLAINTSTKDAGSGSFNVSISEDISGLTANTIYYYKVTATNVNGTTVSDTRNLFTNNSIPRTDLVVWLRADQGVTSSSGNVSEWIDLSSCNNKAEQNNSSNKPTVVSEAINLNPALSFNGTTSKLTLPTSASLGIQSNPYEMFFAAKSSSSNVQFLIAGGANEQFEYHLNGAAGARFIPVTSVYIDQGTAGNYTNGNAHVFSARASESGGVVRVDGVDAGTSSGNILSSNSGNLLIGARSDNTYYFEGSIAEVIIYNTNLSSADRNTVEQYLANRYGITSGALPVELTSFTANYNDGKVLLNWQTATEVNNYGFEIQLKKDNGEWRKIGFQQGHGNLNSPKNYSFTDNLALAHNLNLDRISYRLKQIDFDGKYEYSDVVEVKVETPTQFMLAQNYPNPFNPETIINYQLPQAGHVTLKVYNVLGKEVATLVDEQKEAGTYYCKLRIENGELPSGIYFYRLKAAAFIATKKFLLVK